MVSKEQGSISGKVLRKGRSRERERGKDGEGRVGEQRAQSCVSCVCAKEQGKGKEASQLF